MPEHFLPLSVFVDETDFGETIILVDTGTIGSTMEILTCLGEKGRKAGDISRILLSHSHPDHIGSAAELKALASCRVGAHTLDRRWIEGIETQISAKMVHLFYW